MDGNAELLNYIYQNSQMGVDTISQILEITEKSEFKECLKEQFKGYERFHISARELLDTKGHDEKGIGSFDKMKTYLMLNMKIMSDSSPSHIAEMLIIGSNMGIVDAIKNLRKYAEADADARSLMDELLKFEECNVKKLKMFL